MYSRGGDGGRDLAGVHIGENIGGKKTETLHCFKVTSEIIDGHIGHVIALKADFP